MSETESPRIVLDGTEYSAEGMSDAARGALESLRFTEARLSALHSELAVSRTAQSAYMRALKEHLPRALEDG